MSTKLSPADQEKLAELISQGSAAAPNAAPPPPGPLQVVADASRTDQAAHDALVTAVAAARAAGCNLRDISDATGGRISHQTVNVWCRQRGIRP